MAVIVVMAMFVLLGRCMASPSHANDLPPMFSSSNTVDVPACITPNPDLAGIGVRLSVYIQSFITLALAALFASDAFVNSQEREVLQRVNLNILTVACALLLSAFIEAGTSDLSAYHALIVLNLCWMTVASVLTGFIFPILRWPWPFRGWVRKLWPYKPGTFFLFPIYVSLMASFGIWIWAKPKAFDMPGCSQTTYAVVFGHYVHIANPSIRIPSLIIYAIAAIPAFNFIIFAAIVSACSAAAFYALASISRAAYSYRPLYLFAVAVLVFVNTVLLVDLELMIRKNRASVVGGESSWTFGQSLALILAVNPVLEILGVVKMRSQSIPLGKRINTSMEWQLQQLVGSRGGDWNAFHCAASEQIQQTLAFVKQERSADHSKVALHAFAAAESALAAAMAALDAADAVFRPDRQAADDESRSETVYIADIDGASETVARMKEDVVYCHSLWFPEVYHNVVHYSAVKASLKAATSSLVAAQSALQVINVEPTEVSIQHTSRDTPSYPT